MIESYAEEQEIEQQEQTDMSWQLAKVAGVYSDGLALIFPGETAAGGKHYKCNTFFKYAANDRVLVVPDAGTYIVVCNIGSPATTLEVDKAATATSATSATTAQTATTATTAQTATSATSATTAQTATTATTANGLAANALGTSSSPYGTAYINTLYAGKYGSYFIKAYNGVLAPDTSSTIYPFSLGSSTYFWHKAYIGSMEAHIGSGTSSKLSFFGATAVTRQTVSNSADVSTLITALKNYGLIG